eukprot:scaffold73496_cov66-Phaeocystis_antarctica.AAC.4
MVERLRHSVEAQAARGDAQTSGLDRLKALVELQMRKHTDVEETMRDTLSGITRNITREVCAFMKRYVNAKLHEMAELNRLEWARPSGDSGLQVEAT